MPALRTARVAVGSALRSLGSDAAVAKAPGFDEAWDVASSVPGWFTRENAAAFWGVIGEVSPRRVVEIGSYQGRSTVLIGKAMQAFSPDGCRLTAIDPHTGDRQQLEMLNVDALPTLDLFRLHTSGAGISGLLDTRVALSTDVASTWDLEKVDLVFVDGWHSYEAVLADTRAWAPHLSERGLICFDDFGNYPDVREGVIEGCREAALNFHGLVVAQAWAGRADVPPAALRRSMRWTGHIR